MARDGSSQHDTRRLLGSVMAIGQTTSRIPSSKTSFKTLPALTLDPSTTRVTIRERLYSSRTADLPVRLH